MFILVDKDNNTVFYASNEIYINGDVILTENFNILKDANTYDKIEILKLPNHYINNKFKYIEGNFTYINEADEVADKWVDIRNRRNILLSQSDNLSGILWFDLWASKSDADKTAWTSYRQALRSIPETYTNPDEVVWPVLPGTEVPVANTAPTE